MTSTPPDSSDQAWHEEGLDADVDPGRPLEPEADAPEPDEQPDEPEPATPERVRTGSDRVDEVIRAVEELDERPLEEHVGVFESAQVQLRRALDDPGDDDQVGGAEHPDDHPGHA